MPHLMHPTQPGIFLKTEVLDPHGLSVTEAAWVLGVSRPALSAVLNGRAALSPEMALRVEKAFGLKMETLLQMQTRFAIATWRNKAASIKVKAYRPASS